MASWLTRLACFVMVLITRSSINALPIETADASDNDIFGPPKLAPVGINNFLGIGYNILEANPEGGDLYLGGVDPGLLVTRPIFQLTYNNNQLTSDREYLVPDQVAFTPRSSCVTTKSQGTFYGTESYIKRISVDVGMSASTVLSLFSSVKFSASAHYEQIMSQTEGHGTVFYDERTVCNRGRGRYRNELVDEEKFPLDGGFVAAACQLPATYDLESYVKFIANWGTHVVTQVDLGQKTTERFAESRMSFVQYARTNVPTSVSVEAGVFFDNVRAGLSVDTQNFDCSLNSSTRFGSLSNTFTSGGDDLSEPIAVSVIGIEEIFDEHYWGLFQDYAYNGLCDPTWIDNLSTIKENIAEGLNAYIEWKKVSPGSDPWIAIPVGWPNGLYALPKPDAGCPYEDFNWAEGWRYQHNEHASLMSDPLHFAGPIGEDFIERHFCLKTREEADSYNWEFQPGKYCVIREGGSCPNGFQEGSIFWDDEDTANENSFGGELPDSDFYTNTLVEYCCRSDGYASNPIFLPIDHPFYLIKKNHQCQEVYLMSNTEEFYQWDTENSGTNNNLYTGDYPYREPGVTGSNIRIDYCYYTPLNFTVPFE